MSRDITDEVTFSKSDFTTAKKQGQHAEKAGVHSSHWADTVVKWILFIPMFFVNLIISFCNFVVIQSGATIASVVLWIWAMWLCASFYHTLLFSSLLPIVSQWSLSFSLNTWLQILAAFSIGILVEVAQSKGWKVLLRTMAVGDKPRGYWYGWELVWVALTAMETAIFLNLSHSKGFSLLSLIELVIALFGAKAAEEFATIAKKGSK